jgi:hypothetical protein
LKPVSKATAQRLRYADGYLALGLLTDASNELELIEGEDRLSNEVLIRNQSEHTAITAYQNSTIRQLARGETRRIDFPTPPESLRVHPKSVTSLPIEHKRK